MAQAVKETPRQKEAPGDTLQKAADADSLDKRQAAQFMKRDYEGCLKTTRAIMEKAPDNAAREACAGRIYSYGKRLLTEGDRETALEFFSQGIGAKGIGPSLKAQFYEARAVIRLGNGDRKGYEDDKKNAEALEKEAPLLQKLVDRMLFH
jgi:tetratricopeptide (TPR) repeat protein